ncbi:MAG: hypothetical protein AMXMBFR25_09810 [Lysobacterales bacterium]
MRRNSLRRALLPMRDAECAHGVLPALAACPPALVSLPRALLLCIAATLGPTLHAATDEHPIDAELSRCMESPEGISTHGTRACIDAATAAWDRELNRVWKELRQELPAATFASLRESQRKWIAFRDAELAALLEAYGAMQGTMFQPMHAESISRLTRDRVRQLEALLEAQRISVQ